MSVPVVARQCLWPTMLLVVIVGFHFCLEVIEYSVLFHNTIKRTLIKMDIYFIIPLDFTGNQVEDENL